MSTPRLPASNGRWRVERFPSYPSVWENCGSATAEGGQTVSLDGCPPPNRVRPSDSRSVDNGGHVDSTGEYYCGDHFPGRGRRLATMSPVSLKSPSRLSYKASGRDLRQEGRVQ